MDQIKKYKNGDKLRGRLKKKLKKIKIKQFKEKKLSIKNLNDKTKNVDLFNIKNLNKLDKTNKVYFISTNAITNYINDHLAQPLINIGNYPLKTRNQTLVKETVDKIITIMNNNYYEVIFLLYNCVFVTHLVNTLHSNDLTMKVIAWHQKNYFNDILIPKLYGIVEYSKLQLATRPSYKKYNKKYIYIPYPAILPKTYDEIIENTNELWKKRYDGKYIISGGNNGRDYKQMVKIAYNNQDINVIILCSDDKSINKIKKELNSYKIDNKFANFKYYTDSDPYQFAYAIQKSYFMVLPFVSDKKQIGHSVIALAVYFGKPVITNSNSGMDEAIIHNKNGLLVLCKQYEQYHKFIKMLWNNTKLYNKLENNMIKNSYLRKFDYYQTQLVELSKKAISNTVL